VRLTFTVFLSVSAAADGAASSSSAADARLGLFLGFLTYRDGSLRRSPAPSPTASSSGRR
jgi:hypothetical protein